MEADLIYKKNYCKHKKIANIGSIHQVMLVKLKYLLSLNAADILMFSLFTTETDSCYSFFLLLKLYTPDCTSRSTYTDIDDTDCTC